MEWLKNAIVHYSRFQSEINPFQLSRVQHLSFFVNQLSFVTSLNLSQLGLDSEMLGKLSLRSFTGLRSLNLDTNDIDQMPIQFIKVSSNCVVRYGK